METRTHLKQIRDRRGSWDLLLASEGFTVRPGARLKVLPSLNAVPIAMIDRRVLQPG